MAGLGDYAYNERGWRKVAILGEDYSFPYTQAAGFVSEFTSLRTSSTSTGDCRAISQNSPCCILDIESQNSSNEAILV